MALVATFVTVTVAPGTTAPDESATSPTISPSVCPHSGKQKLNTKTNVTKKIHLGMLGLPIPTFGLTSPAGSFQHISPEGPNAL